MTLSTYIYIYIYIYIYVYTYVGLPKGVCMQIVKTLLRLLRLGQAHFKWLVTHSVNHRKSAGTRPGLNFVFFIKKQTWYESPQGTCSFESFGYIGDTKPLIFPSEYKTLEFWDTDTWYRWASLLDRQSYLKFLVSQAWLIP
jgi:hypothetical protein